MKIQNAPSFSLETRTPQKIRENMNKRLAIFAPVSALGMAAMQRFAKVVVNTRYVTRRRNIKPPRRSCSFVTAALRYRPMG